MTQPPVRFSVTGLNHGHIYGQTESMLDAGAEAVSLASRPGDEHIFLVDQSRKHGGSPRELIDQRSG